MNHSYHIPFVTRCRHEQSVDPGHATLVVHTSGLYYCPSAEWHLSTALRRQCPRRCDSDAATDYVSALLPELLHQSATPVCDTTLLHPMGTPLCRGSYFNAGKLLLQQRYSSPRHHSGTPLCDTTLGHMGPAHPIIVAALVNKILQRCNTRWCSAGTGFS